MDTKTTLRQAMEHFPQISAAPQPGDVPCPAYRQAALRGEIVSSTLPHLIGSPDDRLWYEQTPAGSVPVLYLHNRQDFECCYQILACKCCAVPVPDTLGAVTIFGLNDWGAIHTHMQNCPFTRPADRRAEQQRFLSDPKNYKTPLVLLSGGCYSAVPAAQTPWEEPEWLSISRSIRLYHELTHVVCRSLYPQYRHEIFDEVLADCMGLLFAIGRYDTTLAKRFLGIAPNGSYTGGRLANYPAALPPQQLAPQVCRLIDALAAACTATDKKEYALLQRLESRQPEFTARYLKGI